jgi:hypothetical protein
MYVELVPNRNSPPAVLLRESYREGGKVKKRTLANFSSLSPERIRVLQKVFRCDLDYLAGQEATAGPVFGLLFALDRIAEELGISRALGRSRGPAWPCFSSWPGLLTGDRGCRPCAGPVSTRWPRSWAWRPLRKTSRLAVGVFRGNTADPATLTQPITALRDRFSVQEVVLVGDRGMIKTRGKGALRLEGRQFVRIYRKTRPTTRCFPASTARYDQTAGFT